MVLFAIARTAVPPYLAEYRPDLHFVLLRWLRESTFAETQESFAAALALARQHDCTRWLMDVRQRGPIAVDVASWLVKDFLPVAVGAFSPRVLRLAVLSTPTRIRQQYVDATVADRMAALFAPERPYQSHLFAAEDAAMAWLLAPAA